MNPGINPHRLAMPFLFLGQGLLDLLFPPYCDLCDTRLDQGVRFICESCLDEFSTVLHKVDPPSADNPLDGIYPLYRFNEDVKQALHILKYSNRPAMGIRLLEARKTDLQRCLGLLDVDIVMPVPLHPRKERERGYNQVSGTAEWLADLLSVKSAVRGLKRIKYTQSQTKLSAAERAVNVKDAFQVNSRLDVARLTCLLVDDVFTTGSTAGACAQILKAAGVRRVYLFTLATADTEKA